MVVVKVIVFVVQVFETVDYDFEATVEISEAHGGDGDEPLFARCCQKKSADRRLCCLSCPSLASLVWRSLFYPTFRSNPPPPPSSSSSSL